jgi:hypothetical protein
MDKRKGQLSRMPDDAKVNLSRYKTNELVQKVAEILSVPESVRTVLKTTLFAIVFLVTANSMLYATANRALIPWLLSTMYALAAAILFGFVLGLIRVAGLLVSRVENLLQLTLETSRAVVKDFPAIRSGAKRMPTAAEIVEHVYDGVILPAIETSVAKSFGIIGAPLLWIYRRTIGSSVRFLLTRMKTAPPTDDQPNELVPRTMGLMQDVADNAARIEVALTNALGYTDYASKVLRRILLYPLQVVFVLFALLALVPLGLCWYWTC